MSYKWASLISDAFDQFKERWTEKVQPLGVIEFIFKTDNLRIISWWHRTNQYPHELCYYTFCSVIQAGIS